MKTVTCSNCGADARIIRDRYNLIDMGIPAVVTNMEKLNATGAASGPDHCSLRRLTANCRSRRGVQHFTLRALKFISAQVHREDRRRTC